MVMAWNQVLVQSEEGIFVGWTGGGRAGKENTHGERLAVAQNGLSEPE